MLRITEAKKKNVPPTE